MKLSQSKEKGNVENSGSKFYNNKYIDHSNLA